MTTSSEASGTPSASKGPTQKADLGAGRRWIRRLLLLGIALLYIASVPWYREAAPEGELHIVWGLPDWVAVALGCYVGVAVLNSLAWLLTEVPDHLDADEDFRP